MSENPTHYSLLKDHYQGATKAAARLEDALERYKQADTDIREARKQLTALQALISKWYLEEENIPMRATK